MNITPTKLRSLILEEITNTDKKEIKAMIAKELEKELRRQHINLHPEQHENLINLFNTGKYSVKELIKGADQAVYDYRTARERTADSLIWSHKLEDLKKRNPAAVPQLDLPLDLPHVRPKPKY